MMDRVMMNQNVRTEVVLLVLLLLHVSTTTATTSDKFTNTPYAGSFRNKTIPMGGRELLVPVEPTKYQIFLPPYGSGNGGEGGRRLAQFQQCGQCNCCTNNGVPSTCKNMPCCFGVDCQIPGKPYGVCGFRPKKCDCINCT